LLRMHYMQPWRDIPSKNWNPTAGALAHFCKYDVAAPSGFAPVHYEIIAGNVAAVPDPVCSEAPKFGLAFTDDVLKRWGDFGWYPIQRDRNCFLCKMIG